MVAFDSILTTQTPANPDLNDSASYTLSALFSSDIDGWIYGVRWRFPLTLPSGVVKSGLLRYIDDATPGPLLGSGVFTAPAAGAWNQSLFDVPAHITAGSLYYAAIQTNDHYVTSPSGSLGADIVNGHLRMLADEGGIPRRNNRFFPFSGSAITYPTGGNGALYFVDVLFSTVSPDPVVLVPDFNVHIRQGILYSALTEGAAATHIAQAAIDMTVAG